MNPEIEEFKRNVQKTAEYLKEDLKSIRSGRANPAMLEGIIVEAYGGASKLKLVEMAGLTMSDPSTISITPYDPSTVQDVEKAILKSPLGINPQTQGNQILVRIPPLSEEQRVKIGKLVSQKVEEKKMVVRNHRDEVRKKVKSMFDAKTITEDDKYRIEKEIETITQNSTNELNAIKEKKEQEIMEV